MRIQTEADVTNAVQAVMAQTTDPRLREIMTSLIAHLHGFVRDVRLTEPEFRKATALINAIGQASNDRHNEAVLMAGSLGVSALVCLLNNGDNGREQTTQNLLGPFWRRGAPEVENGGSLVRCEMPGDPMVVDLTFRDRAGQPIEGVKVDIWHCSSDGLYENQDPRQADYNFRGTLTSDAAGRIWCSSLRPSGYPIPTNSVVGSLLAAQNRHPNRPAHVHALAWKDGYKTLISQIYDSEDPFLDSDVQFGVTDVLVGRYVRHDEVHPAGLAAPWYLLKHDMVMEPGTSELPIPPIK
jgi:catechol 1,2-dioxygenase